MRMLHDSICPWPWPSSLKDIVMLILRELLVCVALDVLTNIPQHWVSRRCRKGPLQHLRIPDPSLH